MQGGTQDNAMTEVALALAMGFFSILVLTMVSMGAGSAEDAASTPATVILVPSNQGASSEQAPRDEDTIIVYHQHRFFDAGLTPVDPQTIHTEGRVVLVLGRDLPMSEVMAAHAQISAPNLVVSTYDDRWEDALKQKRSLAGGQP